MSCTGDLNRVSGTVCWLLGPWGCGHERWGRRAGRTERRCVLEAPQLEILFLNHHCKDSLPYDVLCIQCYGRIESAHFCENVFQVHKQTIFKWNFKKQSICKLKRRWREVTHAGVSIPVLMTCVDLGTFFKLCKFHFCIHKMMVKIPIITS